MVLKGSKLYFHKPPGDRAAAIKELFPSGLVAVIEEDVEEEEGPSRTNKDREETRKKRAFWGRRTHPDLVTEDGKVQRGTLEALVHESIFGTTFSPKSETATGEEASQKESEWRDFASSVLLLVPYLVDRTKFELEFHRCASYFVNGADEQHKESARSRVAWLTSHYIAYHSKPAGEESWKEFCRDIIPSAAASATQPPSLPATPPNMGKQSPRPGESERIPTLASAVRLGTPTSRGSPSSPATSVRSTTSRVRLWSLLEASGFTREIFLKLEPDTVARSLLLYQRSILEAATSVTADVLFAESPLTPLVEFFGCDDMPHWLTRTVVMQILGPGQAQSSLDDYVSGAGMSTDDHASRAQTSRTHVRAEVIGRWARVGEMSRLAGDECSWHAIVAALCSKPIARLEKAWRRVDSTAINVVRTWVYASQGGERASVAEPRMSPWGGDGRYRVMKLLEKLHEGKSNEWQCEGMYEARRLFDGFAASFKTCRVRESRQREASEDEDVYRLLQHWKELSKKPPPMKIHRINQFMSLSFAAEAKKKGLFAPYYWSRQASHGPQVLIPLMVPELLPTVALIDRAQLVRTKKLSYESSTALGDSQVVHPPELQGTVEPDGHIRSGGATRHNVRGGNAFDLGGMILPVFDGELLLCVVSSSESNSRPVSRGEGGPAESAISSASPSRQPSIRVKSAAAGLDRKSSRARRASLPALSQKSSAAAVVVVEQNGEPPLHAVVQAGTLDALVQVLIHGLDGVSVSVADDNGEMALRDKKTRAVKVDRVEFARVWWNAFRSFVSPFVLFQLLRKEFLSSSPPRGSASRDEIAQAIHSRQAVIRVIAEWMHLGSGAQDALDDVELHAAMQSFLGQHAEKDLSNLVSQSDQLSQLLKSYEAERASLLNTFVEQTMRPQSRSIPVRGQASDNNVHNFGIRAPKLEDITPDELVDNLDAMAAAAFRNVNQDDLYVTADLLEVQTSDRTGWFLPREPTSLTDEVEIQTLYTFIMEVEPTSYIGEYSGETLYRLLPPGVRSLLRAYSILRKWAVCCLATPQLGIKARQARIELFLKAVEICRMRSVDPQAMPSDLGPVKQPCVRSFVEAVLTSAIVSPESRIFGRAWQGVASARGAQIESITSMLSARKVESVASNEKLTVDPAWLLERVLEIISLSDVLDSPMDLDTPLSLVNFDKRRQLHNVITNASSYAARGNRQRREMDRMDFERLNRIEQEFADVVFDIRLLRDEAQREAASMGPLPTPSKKGGPRPFQRAVLVQQEKNKRDKYMRKRLMEEKRYEQQRLERKEDDLNRAMDARSQTQAGGVKHQRGKRSMSALFSLMRPISTAFTSESSVMPKRSAAELDFMPTQKPALALSLVDAHVSAFINNERSFTFQIDTEDGGHYLLQGLSKSDMNAWMQTIGTAIKSHAQRRLTYIATSSPLQVADHVQPRPITASQDPKAVFGVDLTFLVRRESGGEVPLDAVPRVLELCLKEIEDRGLTEQGIYRVAGATTEVSALREALNNGQTHIDRYTDINAVCGVVKYWFRVLPETVIPELFFEPIVEAARLPDLDERLAKIREVVHLFPRAHFSVLKRLAEHMDRVVDYEEQNHMTPDNLAVVICPNLLRAPNNNFGLIMKNMGPLTVLFKALITHIHVIFDEDVGEEGEEGEEGDEEEELLDDDSKLYVPEVDFGPRFVASPEPDELLIASSPDR
ncbi:uncharacterized protein FOMMEDRAFT_118141 [Fomitiporia mediterranea MF3/22]|uniref:uncharacterized protein n=1 Tax=Fomitiporia mediterranea (strain MF3/22) TaxID=694068 RepID=UPI0004409A1F|nr:uncharacterized protein FOMMEDRAFT_118141 [Fomitiporia mediterranea MF3/22]EJD07051.1 hypothetical protein FOMMEDRAFT_118141 [Fomitiporia mediterranea MF3/22]